MKKDLIAFRDEVSLNPQIGIPLGNNCFKVRLAITSKGKGKSGGARIITNLHISGETIFLLTIYDKTEKEKISQKEIKYLLQYLKK